MGGLERASEDELNLASAETPDFPMWTDLDPNFDQSTELRSAALWLDFLERCKCWYGSEVDVCIIHLGWACDWIIDSALFVLERTKQLGYATNYTEGFAHRDLTSTGYRDFVEESHVCHVCLSFLLTIVMLLYSPPEISSNKNPYPNRCGTWPWLIPRNEFCSDKCMRSLI